MASQARNILVFGATGLIGVPIVDELIRQKGAFGRIAVFTSAHSLTAKEETISKFRNAMVEIFSGHISNEEYLRNILAGSVKGSETTAEDSVHGHGREASAPFDTIISALGRGAILEQMALFELAERIPTVKRIFPSEYGTDIEYDETSASEPPHQAKLQIRSYIATSLRRLEHTYLVTGPYSDLYLSKMSTAPEMGSFDVRSKQATLPFDGETPIALTSIADVARFLVAALQRPDVSRKRTLKVHSFTATPNEILVEFERQTGGQKWQVSYVPPDRFKELEKAAYENKSPLAHLFTLRRIWAEGKTLYDKNDKGDLGVLTTETLPEAVSKAIADVGDAFRSTAM